MPSRREVLWGLSAGVAAAALPAGAYAETEDIDICRFYADKLAAAMKLRHGGEWTANINADYGFAVIVKDG
jgi:hypothetical protein